MFNKIAVVVGLVLGLLAVVMVNVHVSQIKSSEQAVKIVRVTRIIRRGEMPESRWEVVTVPESFKAGLETAVSDTDMPLLSARPVNSEIKEGTFLQWSHFEGGGRTGDRAIMEVLTKGKRAMAIPVNAVAAVAGWVRPGDRVDVIGTFTTNDREGNARVSTMTILQNMKVMAIGGKTDYSDDVIKGRVGDRSAGESVVLEVSPQEAELITFAQHQGGSLSLTLRRPDDDVVNDIPKMNWDNFSTVTKAPVAPQR